MSLLTVGCLCCSRATAPCVGRVEATLERRLVPRTPRGYSRKIFEADARRPVVTGCGSFESPVKYAVTCRQSLSLKGSRDCGNMAADLFILYQNTTKNVMVITISVNSVQTHDLYLNRTLLLECR